ncbi:MAG: DUF2961 domain-containing protein [Clostridia bacterium]|nr:DUF2961 domain-containing protein [Clostridia bacterium]
MFDGISNSMSTMYRLSNAKSRSVCSENPTGGKGQAAMAETGVSQGCARELGRGWKVNPYSMIQPGENFVMADIQGPGAIQHIWMTIGPAQWREMIFRIYWDDMENPAVEVPAGDFFANGWNEYAPVVSLPICVNPCRGFNSYFVMPFRKRALIKMENRSNQPMPVYYSIDYTEGEVEADAAYFCAAFRRSNPTQGSIHTILDHVRGKGQYVGTYLAWQVNNNGWWGEGEVKFYLDGDKEFPTICSTGTEDFFCGAYNFDVPGQGYAAFCTPYSGMPQVIRPDGLYRSNTRFGLYRFHVTDPIRFEEDVKVTVQDLGWRSEGRYLAQHSDISSVAYWYQTGPVAPQPPLPAKNELEII